MFSNPHHCIAGILFIVLLYCTATVVDAQETEPAFNQLYGTQITKVQSTHDNEDDVALAKQLLQAAEQIQDNPKVAAACLRQAIALGAADRSGIATAIEAGRKLNERFPEQTEATAALMLPIFRKAYAYAPRNEKPAAAVIYFNALAAAGDRQAKLGNDTDAIKLYRLLVPLKSQVNGVETKDIYARIRGAKERAQVIRRIDQLKQEVLANPASSQAQINELVRLLICELEDAEQAARFAAFSDDKQLVSNVQLSTQPIESLNADQLFQLGQWYYQIAEQATTFAKTQQQCRARNYFQAFLDQAEANSAQAVRAKEIVSRLTDAVPFFDRPMLQEDNMMHSPAEIDQILLGQWRILYNGRDTGMSVEFKSGGILNFYTNRGLARDNSGKWACHGNKLTIRHRDGNITRLELDLDAKTIKPQQTGSRTVSYQKQ